MRREVMEVVGGVSGRRYFRIVTDMELVGREGARGQKGRREKTEERTEELS